MPKVEIEFPEDVLLSLGVDPETLSLQAARQLAYDFYAAGRLSTGLAARLAGMSRAAFLLGLGPQGIPWVEFTPEELRRELTNA